MIDREWSIDIDGEPFITKQTGTRQFRCVFDVAINTGNSLVLADIALYNLSRDTKIPRGKSIVLRAGYTGASDSIFSGFITNIFPERQGADIVTRLLCKTGAPNSRGSANGSYGKGARLVDVLKDLAYSWPINLRIHEEQFKDAPVFTSGYNTNGDIPDALDTLSDAFGFDWTIDRGSLVVSKRGAQRRGAVAQISKFTGMIGIPEVTKGPDGLGVYIMHKLDPYFYIGDRFEITSEFSTFNTGNMYVKEYDGDTTANGEYNFFDLRYRGDSWGDQWAVEINGLRAGSAEPETPSNGTLVWGARVEQDFRNKVRKIAKELGFDPNWIMAVMAFETGRSFSPSKKNPAPGASATGLIQFVESTAAGIGTSTRELSRMSAVEQLDYVKKYYEPYKSKVKNLGDAYMAVLWPRGIGKPDSYVLWTQAGTPREYNANSGLDTNKNGIITRAEAVSRVNAEMKVGAKHAK